MPECPRKTSEELRTLAQDVMTNRVFGSWMVGEGEDPLISFLAVKLSGQLPEKTGQVYEYMEKAELRSVNGYPSFFSCQFLHMDDCAELQRLCQEIHEAMEGVR